jgi:hypothetical protein
MSKDDLKILLTPAVEETAEEKEEEKKAIATFVAACPDDYDDEGNYDGEDEYDDDLMYIEEPEYHIVCEGLSMVNKRIQQITEILALPRGQQPPLSINDFSELTQALQDLKHETFPTRNLTCNYELV